MAWVVIPCLITLRSEFNAVSPNRDKGADGTIGDSNHTSTSDHTPDEDSDALRNKDADTVNEVHALDIDSSGPWPEAGWFGRTIEALRLEEMRRWNDANDYCRLEYIIYNGKIASINSQWKWVTYNGSDPHTNHAHFSGRYLTRTENDTRPWGVEEDDMTPDQMTAWANSEDGQAALRRAVTNAPIQLTGNAAPVALTNAIDSVRNNVLNVWNAVKPASK